MRTTALCSPSRSCIITGRNHHANATAAVNELATGYPGYNGSIPFENGFLPEMLLAHGYSTYMVGKYHLLPSEFESAAGPYDRWPLGRGFERFYGFLGGDTSQWYPDLIYDNHQVEPPRTPEQGYHLTEDLAGKAIQFIADAKQLAPEKPFYLHFCTGATHAPHHVPKVWADRYRGQFDDGWAAYRERVFVRQKELGVMPADAELSGHDADVPEWDSLSPEARRLAARMMEVYAGFLSHTDHHIGRLLDFLKEIGEFENTLIMVVSDNGASAEGGPAGTTNELQFFNNAPEPLEDSLAAIDELGGPSTFNHYPWGWTWAGNTPFRRWKRETYRGGASDPFLVHWPRGIRARGQVRTQYGWRAVCPWPGPSFAEAGKGFGAPITAEDLTDLDAHHWELYHIAEDPAENHDIAADHQDKLIEMIAMWYVEAGKYNVLPIDGSALARLMAERPQIAAPRSQYTYRPGTQTVPYFAGPKVLNRPHAVTADVDIPPGGAEGVLICQGSGVGGWTFYVQGGALVSFDTQGKADPGKVRTYLQANRLDEFGFDPWVGPEPHGDNPLNSASSATAATGRDEKFAAETVELLQELSHRPGQRPWLVVSSFLSPQGITAGPDGALWFTNAGGGSVGRITTTVTPRISSFTPASGPAGTTVTITGQNLSGATRVAFNGTPATIVSGTATQIVTDVPAGATTGHISVTTPAGTATSRTTFTVI